MAKQRRALVRSFSSNSPNVLIAWMHPARLGPDRELDMVPVQDADYVRLCPPIRSSHGSRDGRLSQMGAPFTSNTGGYLLPVLCEGAPAILKVAVHEEERRGVALMAYYAGAGAVRVLARDGDATLLERATGTRSLSRMSAEGEDEETTRILCDTAARLHAPRGKPPTGLVSLDAWFRPLAQAADTHGGAFAAPAAMAAQLLREPRNRMPLHGDLHHGNVLDGGGGRGWLAIDAKGLIGERGFDFANHFRNPTFDVALAPGRLRRRAGIIAERADLDVRRLLQWVLAYAGLGAAWSLEDGDDPAENFGIAEAAAAELRSIG